MMKKFLPMFLVFSLACGTNEKEKNMSVEISRPMAFVTAGVTGFGGWLWGLSAHLRYLEFDDDLGWSSRCPFPEYIPSIIAAGLSAYFLYKAVRGPEKSNGFKKDVKDVL